MGADWIRRNEQKFRHCLQEASKKNLGFAPLFPAGEKITTTYPCHWLQPDQILPEKTPLVVFQHGDKSRVAVLRGSEAVGEVRGEAARDLKELFRNHPDLCNALAVSITRVGKCDEPFYVQPLIERGRDSLPR
jgi:hypothetical protein